MLLGSSYCQPASDRRYTAEVKAYLTGRVFNNTEWRSWKTRSDGSLYCFERTTAKRRAGGWGGDGIPEIESDTSRILY